PVHQFLSRVVASLGLLNGSPKGGGRRGHLESRKAKRENRIADGVDGGNQRANGARLADAFYAQRIDRRRHGACLKAHRRNVVGTRHLIIHQGATDELAGLGVIADRLAKRLANTHSDAALDLAVRQRRIEHIADILDDRIAYNPDHARLRIDLDLDHVATVGKSDGGRYELGSLGEPSWLLGLCIASHIREPDRVVGPPEQKAAVRKADVAWLCVQHLRDKRAASRDYLFGGAARRAAAYGNCARATIAPPVREVVGVAGQVANGTPGQTEGPGNELRQGRLDSLPG